MNTMNVMSKIHKIMDQPWPFEVAYGYFFNDKVHALSAEEFDAIERSGRSSWEQYADVPSVWPGEVTPFLELCHARPGKCEVGERPAEREDLVHSYRGLTSFEKEFIRKYRKCSTLPMLATVLNIHPDRVGEYSRSIGLIGRYGKRHKIELDQLFMAWVQFGADVTLNTRSEAA